MLLALSKDAWYRFLATIRSNFPSISNIACKTIYLLVFLPYVTLAQVSVDITPKSKESSNASLFSGRIDHQTLELPDLNNTAEIQNADAYKAANCPDCRLTYYGKGIPANVNIKGMAQVTRASGGTIWILRVSSNTAKGFQIRFSEFDIPPGATLHIYSPNSNFTLGAYTSRNNNEGGRFFTSIFPENEMVIEYFEPDLVVYPGQLVIDTFIHLFLDPAASLPRSTGDGGGFATSGSCTVDAICGDGNLDDTEAKAVGLISVYQDAGLTAWGTGFLINSTTAGDKKPYFITAAHVMSDRSIVGGGTGYSEAIVTFGYQNAICGTNDFNNPMWKAKSFQGMYLRSVGRTSQTGGKSDYSLWELQDDPKNSLQVAYLGWDKRNITSVAAKPLYNISHPTGDALKVAVMNGASSVVTFKQEPYKLAPDENALNVYVMSLSWAKGVTQPGSSGSPLLSSEKRVIGLLIGGYSRCSDSPGGGGALAGPDHFTRFAYAWNNPNPDFPTLQFFLDQENTGFEYLDTYLSPAITIPDPDPDPDPTPNCASHTLTDPNALKISLPDDAQKMFGRSTSMEGNYFVVGAPGESRAYIYKKNVCEIKLLNTLNGTTNSGAFGWSVSMSGDKVAIGDPSLGIVSVFKNDGTDNFSLLTTVTGENSSSFGQSVSLDGNQLIIGAPYGHDEDGAIYIGEIATNGTWTQVYSHYGNGLLSGFGSAVNIRGNVAVAGAPRYEGRYARIFRRGSSGWAPEKTIDGSYWSNSSTFGSQLSLSDDGEDLIMSGPRTWHWRHTPTDWVSYALDYGSADGGDDIGNMRVSELVNNRVVLVPHHDQGNIKIWEKNSAGRFVQIKDIPEPADRRWDDLFGYPAFGTEYFVIGSPEPSLDCTYSGSIFIYDIPMLFQEDKNMCNVTAGLGITEGRNIYAGGTNCAFSLPSGASATFLANRMVTLSPGFAANAGSVFRASAVSCGGWAGTNIGGARVASNNTQEEDEGSEQVQPEELIAMTEEDDVVVYPSPSEDGILNIRSKDFDITSIVLYSTQGQEISDNTYLQKTGKFVMLKVGSFHGLCLIRVSTASRTTVQKVFIR
jgi:hypothetical protein